METTYYTCLNQHCPKHRNIFLEGDPQHENCRRARLHFQEERRVPVWVWAAVPAALLGIALGVQLMRTLTKRRDTQVPGHKTVAAESERHSVPPPIGNSSRL